MTLSRFLRSAACLLVLSCAAGAAGAQAMDEDQPRLVLSGYLFASGLSGQASTFENLPPADIDLSFGDVLEDFEGGLMGVAEYRTGPVTLLGDMMFTQVRPGGTLQGPLASDVELRQRSLTLQTTALYRLHATPDMRVDLGAGLRYWHMDNKISTSSDALGYRTRSQDQDWVDPVAAARVQVRLAPGWTATAYADYGFSGVGSDETWQLLGTVDYSWNERMSLRMGYRVLATDYRNGDFLYDVTMRGPVLGLAYRF
ncbi:hypothetical protein [Cereibacter johrii]|uniref:Outer membrane protein beta-barrel domain-containing protein n=1 Tax=Cereibacter johrii TaxID=445629 RepID=A0ABX5J4T2_9RHOB|nr:hypothetical protein [Cereibacter johrii]PTM76095.1 hypothetical protein C8J29_1096 [Cereibacter johrii]